MAAKMIRDGLLDSERVQKRSVPARWLFVTIMLIADDVGLFEVSHFKLHRLAALDEKAIPALLDELTAADLIRLYKVKGKAYGFVPRYGQRLRVKRTKHPLPPEELMRDDDDAINKINGLTENPRTDDGEPPQSAATGGLNLNLNQKKDKTDPSLRSGSAPPPDGGVPPKAKKPRAPRPKKDDPPTPSVLAWNGYSTAYLARYGVAPVRNARVNGQLANFVTRIPAAEVEAVAAFFISHNGNLYVNARHPVDLLIRDAEKLRTDWAVKQRTDPQLAPRQDAATETAFQRSRREAVERMTGGKVSKAAPTTIKEVFDAPNPTLRRLD